MDRPGRFILRIFISSPAFFRGGPSSEFCRNRPRVSFFAFQIGDLVSGQISPLTRFERAKFQCPDSQADDLHHRQSQQFAHFADLTFFAFAHHHPNPRSFTGSGQKIYFCGCGLVAIFKHNTALPCRKLFFIRAACHENTIFFFLIMDTPHWS